MIRCLVRPEQDEELNQRRKQVPAEPARHFSAIENCVQCDQSINNQAFSLMIQVSYISQTSAPMPAEALLSLLNECRRNNEKLGVTGLLLYANGTFLQAVEGETKVVDELVERICGDSRHENIKMLRRIEIDEPQYAEWSMGFNIIGDDDLDEIEGLRNFTAETFDFSLLIENDTLVDTLLKRYRKTSWDKVIGEIDAQQRVLRDLEQALARARDRAALARLALESITEASRHGKPSESLIELCESAIDSLRAI